VVPEAPLEETEAGLAAVGDGWFVLNARNAPWYEREGRGFYCEFEDLIHLPQVGVNLTVVRPGEPMAMYHWEADQENFLVLAGEAILIVEGEERPLRKWDFVHCPRDTKHTIVGAGDGPCVVLAIGARDHQGREGWGGYSVDEAAIRHGAGVEEETTDATVAYARFKGGRKGRYPDGLLET